MKKRKYSKDRFVYNVTKYLMFLKSLINFKDKLN